MTNSGSPPNPLRFSRTFRVVPPPPSTNVPIAPTTWSDAITFPMDRHFFVDTGIFHSIACSIKSLGFKLLAVIQDHELSEEILNEVLTQRANMTLSKMSGLLIPMLRGSAQPLCAISQEDLGEIETIRNELIADAQRRRRAISSNSANDKHSGEAVLIYYAAHHSPPAHLVSNDAGANAVGARHNVASIHFLHLLRFAVRNKVISVDEALAASQEGFSESGLSTIERTRTENRSWLGS